MDGFHKTFWHPQVPILVLIYVDCSRIIQVSISLQNEAMFFFFLFFFSSTSFKLKRVLY